MNHHASKEVLGLRTVDRDHRVLAGLLRAGMRVLDVGCGTGSITAGIARAVGPDGLAIGLDRDAALLDSAAADVHRIRGDGLALPFGPVFDIVTAARTMQWFADSARAIREMARATKPGGVVVVLDYNHADNAWDPEPPPEFQRFYRAFMRWRESSGWDNRMADRLTGLFSAAGLVDIESSNQDERVVRGEADFAERAAIWRHVIESVGAAMSWAGVATEAELDEALRAYSPWTESTLRSQTLRLRAVVGRKP